MAIDPAVAAYLAAQPPKTRALLQTMMRTVRAAVPEATDAVISYQIPAFGLFGQRRFLYVAGWKDHVAIYPTPRDIGSLDLGVGKVVGHTLRLPLDAPLPLDVITKVAQMRAAEMPPTKASSTTTAKTAKKKTAKKKTAKKKKTTKKSAKKKSSTTTKKTAKKTAKKKTPKKKTPKKKP